MVTYIRERLNYLYHELEMYGYCFYNIAEDRIYYIHDTLNSLSLEW